MPSHANEQLSLRLFVTADSPGAQAARENLQKAIEGLELPESAIEIVDVFESPGAALEARIIVTPTLQIRRGNNAILIAGRLSNIEKVRSHLTERSVTSRR